MQDKYGIELDLYINGFKAKIKEAKGEAKSLAQELKLVNKGDTLSGGNMNIFSDKISIASGKAKLLSDNFKLVKPAIQQATTETNKLDSAIQRTGSSGRQIGSDISTSFNKGLRSVKRLIIGFLGARSLFSLFRQQLSAYRSENEYFNQQMMLTSNIITTALAPAFQFFGNVIQYATIALAKIIDIMFGTNISAKVLSTGIEKANKQLAGMSSGMNDVSNSAKELKDNLLGIDEITNLQQEGTGTGLLGGIGGADLSGIQDQFKALDEFKKKMQEVNEWFDRHPEIVKFFKTLGGIIKDIVGFAVKHPWATILGIGAFMTLKGLLPAILGTGAAGSLAGVSGLLGVAVVLSFIAGIELSNLINKWKELDGLMNKTDQSINNNSEQTDKFNKKVKETDFSNWDKNHIEEFFSMSEAHLKTNTDLLKKHNKEYIDGKENANILEYAVMSLNGEYAQEEKMLQDDIKEMMSKINIMKVLHNQGLLNEDQEKRYKKTLIDTKNELLNSGLQGKEYESALKDIDKQLNNLNGKKTKSTIEIKAKAETKEAEKDYSNFFSRLASNTSAFIGNLVSLGTARNKYVSLFKQNGGIFTGSWQPITAFAGGGVPNSGQMFMAREAGPELVGTIGGHTAVMNNDQIVASVSAGVYQAVVSAMGGQSDRPIVLNINGKEFAKATYGDYQEEGSRRGANTSIRRV